MKKKKYKYIAVILAVAVGINCSMGIATNGVFIATAEENGVKEAEEKIECTATIEDYFDDSSVLVVLDKQTSEINKTYSPSSFGNIGACSVEDLTYIEKDIEDCTYLDTENFQNLLTE